MRFSTLTIFCFLLFQIACNAALGAITKEQEDGFKNFITLAILNYANWARSNGTNELFIESPVNIESRAGMAEYNAEFWNQTITGFTEVDDFELSTSLMGGYFEVYTYTNKYNVTGSYRVNGSVFSTIPIEGAGPFNKAENEDPATVLTYFSDLRIVDDHIVLKEEPPYGDLYLGVWKMDFTNLSAGGYETQVKEQLEQDYLYNDDVVIESVINATKVSMQTYFKQVFAETPFSEIIGMTPPPPETTTARVRTTTEVVCPNEQSGTVLSEKVIDRKVVQEGGKTVVYTTKNLVFREEL